MTPAAVINVLLGSALIMLAVASFINSKLIRNLLSRVSRLESRR